MSTRNGTPWRLGTKARDFNDVAVEEPGQGSVWHFNNRMAVFHESRFLSTVVDATVKKELKYGVRKETMPTLRRASDNG